MAGVRDFIEVRKYGKEDGVMITVMIIWYIRHQGYKVGFKTSFRGG